MQFGRRRFLRGWGGAAVGLPWLASLAGRGAQASTGAKRFVVMFSPCGVDISRFWPTGTGFGKLTDASFQAGCGIAPLKDMKHKLLVPRGLQGSPRGYNRDGAQNGANDHELGTGSRLTCARLPGINGYPQGISVDQFVANHLQKGKPALTLGAGRVSGRAADRYISYLSPGRPAPRQNNPWSVYKELMSVGGDRSGAAAELILKRRQSVLDFVRADLQELTTDKRLGAADKAKLDMHFTAIRDLETNLAGGGACKLDDPLVNELMGINPSTVTQDAVFPKIANLQINVLAMALACGATRSATLMFHSGEGDPKFTWLGLPSGQHLISHPVVRYDSRTPLQGAVDMLNKLDVWYAQRFGELIKKLDAYDEGGRTLLDNSAVVWVNELSNGARHHFEDLPFVVAGSAGGILRQGEYVRMTTSPIATGPDRTTPGPDAPHNKLWTTIVNALGCRQTDGKPYEMFGQYGGRGEYRQLVV
jgi:hypothetical protein